MISKIISTIGNFYLTGNTINKIIGTIFTICASYKVIWFIIGMFFTRKFKPAKNKHKYGIVISARNEEKVIGNLLDSINKQDYPKELYQVFVVADNCTDKTAEIARKKGAIVYERFDLEHKTKGYALEYLFDRIEEDYKRNSYEGYFVFDADNLLEKNFISKMNDAFDSGVKIVTSYRATKNFNESWISSTYAIHWLRSIRENHRARSVLRLATNIQGTGYLFASEVVENGWHYTSLTEDRALTADAVSQGYQISYQNEAIFYDEQPTNLRVSLRQRTRWSRGHLEAFVETGPKLFVNVIFGKLFLKNKWNKNEKKETLGKRIIESIRRRIASFDTLVQLTPISFINLLRWLIFSLIIYSCYSYNHGLYDLTIFKGDDIVTKLASSILTFNISIGPGYKALLYGLLFNIIYRIIYRVSMCLSNMLIAIYIFIIERKNIPNLSLRVKIIAIITWPTFDLIGVYTTWYASFKKVEWKPIPHESNITINDLK